MKRAKQLSILEKVKTYSAEQIINYLLNLFPQVSDKAMLKAISLFEVLAHTPSN